MYPTSSTQKRTALGKRTQLPDCLNPECGEKNLVKDCPRTSDAKKELLQTHRAKRISEKAEPKVSAVVKPSQSEVSTSEKVSPICPTNPAVVLADLHGHKFACRIDSGADQLVVSDTIVKFLGDKNHFIPTVLLTKPHRMLSVDGSPVNVQGQVQINPTLQTVAGPCRLRNIKAYIMPCEDTHTLSSASCPGEIVLGNPFLYMQALTSNTS